MYLRVELPRNVVLPPNQLDGEGQILQRAIIIRLWEDFTSHKANQELGYFLVPTTLERIGEGKVRQDSGDVLFPVVFSCITFKPFKGEILHGVVTKILKQGVFLSCGPIEKVYIAAQKMADYHHVPGENPIFINDKNARIEKNVEVSFVVLGTKWVEADREFQIVGSLEGDFLGPV